MDSFPHNTSSDTFFRISHKICCPDCGKEACRSYVERQCRDRLDGQHKRLKRVECLHCDYLLVTCADSEAVVDTFYVC